MFEDLFEQLEKDLPGLKAMTVVGDDGIEVASHVKADLPHEVLSAEMNEVLKTLDRLREEFSIGRTQELVVRTDSQNILLFALVRGMFVLVITEPAEATGRTRYEVQRQAHRFSELLS